MIYIFWDVYETFTHLSKNMSLLTLCIKKVASLPLSIASLDDDTSEMVHRERQRVLNQSLNNKRLQNFSMIYFTLMRDPILPSFQIWRMIRLRGIRVGSTDDMLVARLYHTRVMQQYFAQYNPNLFGEFNPIHFLIRQRQRRVIQSIDSKTRLCEHLDVCHSTYHPPSECERDHDSFYGRLYNFKYLCDAIHNRTRTRTRMIDNFLGHYETMRIWGLPVIPSYLPNVMYREELHRSISRDVYLTDYSYRRMPRQVHYRQNRVFMEIGKNSTVYDD